MQEIIIEIDLDGNAQVEGKGFVGDECKRLTKDIEDEIGEVTSTVVKPEFRRTRANLRKVGA